MQRRPTTAHLAGALLILAGLVLIVTPVLLDAPNIIGTVMGVVTVLIGLATLRGTRATRRVGLGWSAFGILWAGLWVWMAASGFGKGPAWLDDLIEASVLVAIFVTALVFLLATREAHTPNHRDPV